jgi:hypothetical protein
MKEKFTCKLCGESFSNAQDLDIHKETEHSKGCSCGGH